MSRGRLFVIAGLTFRSVMYAQFGTEQLPDQDIGRPPRPPLISFLGIATPGTLLTDISLPPQGPVAEVLHEELRVKKTPAGAAGEVVNSIKIKYDVNGRAIEEMKEGSSITVSRYEGTRLVSQETSLAGGKKPGTKFWNYWVYDPFGKLTEYRRGSGDKLQNHDTNFKRDAQGRLTSFEYRQGEQDVLLTRTEYRYSSDGKTVEVNISEATGDVTSTMVERIDEFGRVASVAIRERDWQTKKLKDPMKVAFRYDAKGRLVEQATDAYAVEPDGMEQAIPPGKVSITYDDLNHAKTTSYMGDAGFLRSTVTFDASGAVIAFRVGTGGIDVDARLECAYDGHDNWTACRQVATQEGKSAAVKSWRRVITYR